MKKLVMNTMVIITNEYYWGIPGYMKWDGGNLQLGKFLEAFKGNYPSCVGYPCNSITIVYVRTPVI